MQKKEQRTVHVGVMVTPTLYKQLEGAARSRTGRPSVSSAVNDILTLFFDSIVSDMTQLETASILPDEVRQ